MDQWDNNHGNLRSNQSLTPQLTSQLTQNTSLQCCETVLLWQVCREEQIKLIYQLVLWSAILELRLIKTYFEEKRKSLISFQNVIRNLANIEIYDS